MSAASTDGGAERDVLTTRRNVNLDIVVTLKSNIDGRKLTTSGEGERVNCNIPAPILDVTYERERGGQIKGERERERERGRREEGGRGRERGVG